MEQNNQPPTQQQRFLLIGMIQNEIKGSKHEILQIMESNVTKAVNQGAQMCIFGEFSNLIPHTKYYKEFSEIFGEVENEISEFLFNLNEEKSKAPTVALMRRLAKKHGIYIIATTIEKSTESMQNDKYFNTAFVVDRQGRIVCKYRKCHLFDVDLPEQNFIYKESQHIIQGSSIGVFTTEWGVIGLGICYDIRFPEYSLLLRQKYHAVLLLFPAAFGVKSKTGEMHWDLLVRARALDNQCFVVGVQPARYQTEDADVYQVWGNSRCADPFGRMISEVCDERPRVEIVQIDFDLVSNARKWFDYEHQRRKDLYSLSDGGSFNCNEPQISIQNDQINQSK